MRYTKPRQAKSFIILQKDIICWSIGPLRWVGSRKENSWSKFVQVAIWVPLGFIRMSPGRCHSEIGSWTLWGVFLIHKPIIRFTFADRRMTSFPPAYGVDSKPRKQLNSQPLSHVVAGYISKSFSFEQVWWVIYSPSPLPTQFLHIFNSMDVYIYIYIYVCVCVCLGVSLGLSVCHCVYLCEFLCMSHYSYQFSLRYVLCFDLLTRPKMLFRVMHRKEVTHSNGSYERKSCGRKLADEMGRGKKKSHYTLIDWRTGREWPVNCMTVISARWRSHRPFQR